MKYWRAFKSMFRYIAGSLNVWLCFMNKYDTFLLEGSVDSDFIGDQNSRKSTNNFILHVRQQLFKL